MENPHIKPALNEPMRTTDTTPSIFTIKIPDSFEEERSTCQTLGSLVENCYMRVANESRPEPRYEPGCDQAEANKDEPLIDPIRGLTNFYRAWHLILQGYGHLFPKVFLHSFQLLLDWMTAAYQNPAFSHYALHKFICRSGTLINYKQEQPGEFQELFKCIGKHDTFIRSGLNIREKEFIPFEKLGNLKENRYFEALWDLLDCEFFSRNAYERTTKPSPTIIVGRKEASIAAYNQQAGMSCILGKTGYHAVPYPFVPVNAPPRPHDPDMVESLRTPNNQLENGPGLEICPWLPDAARVDSSAEFFSTAYQRKTKNLKDWPKLLWDVENSRQVQSKDLKPPCPDYVAISHTWGRWATDKWYKPDGCCWSIPMNKSFNVTVLAENLRLFGREFSTQFVWLDLVCIPQSEPTRGQSISKEDEDLKNQEIARQATIFRNAKHAVAWLHDIKSLSCLSDISELMSLALLKLEPRLDEDEAQRLGRIQDLAQKIQGGTTGLLISDEEYDTIPSEPTGPYIIASGDESKKRPASHWFTSLWTLQEVCLRPDMLLSTSAGEFLSLTVSTNSIKLPLIGFVCLCQQYFQRIGKEFGIVEALEEIEAWAFDTGMFQLLDLSRIDVLVLGDRRHCKEKRAEAIMSAIGVTKWFGDDSENALVPDGEKDLILNKYPARFVEEVRKSLQGDFFAAYIKIWNADHQDQLNLQSVDDTWEDASLKVEFYTWFQGEPWNLTGSMLPFSRIGHIYQRSPTPASRLQHMPHDTIHSWKINTMGNVYIQKACVLSSSRIRNIPRIPAAELRCEIFGFKPSDLENHENLKGRETPAGYSKFHYISLYSWTQTRQFEVHFLVIQDLVVPAGHRNGQPRFVHSISGVILRACHDIPQQTDHSASEHTDLVAIGQFRATSFSEGLPTALPGNQKGLNWRVI